MRLTRGALAVLSFLVGLGLFVHVINQTGPAEILTHIRALGAGFLLVLAISSIRYLTRTIAWFRCLPANERRIGLWRLGRARVVSEAIGDLTFGPLVAEPIKLIALAGRLPTTVGLASLTTENLAYGLSSCLMVAAGTVALLSGFALSEPLRPALLAMFVFALAAAAGAIVLVSRRWTVVSRVATFSRHLTPGDGPRRWIDGQLRRLRAVEDSVFEFYARRRTDLAWVALCHIGFHLGGALETYAVLRLIGYEPTLTTAFVLESANRVLSMAFLFVPMLVGIDELGTGLVARALGLGAAVGVTLAIIRKVRMLVWIAIGLALLAEYRKGSAR